jgi:hypothetical protein
MCNFLSGVMLATGEIAIGELVDSHEQIIADAGWQNADKSAERPGLCRWEYTGPSGDWTKPYTEWGFRVDEQARPEWFTPEREAECISRAQVVLDRMILREGVRKEVKNGERVFVSGGTVQEVSGGTVQEVYGGTVQYVYGGTVQEVYESATVADPTDSGIVIDRGGDTIIIHGNCKLAGVQA